MKFDDLCSSPHRTHALGIRRVRLAGTINLSAWPVAGAFYWAGMPLFGLLCVLIALISFGAIIGTGVHRIAFGQATTEEDIALQMAANAKGYGIVAAGVAITLCVALIGYDTLRVNAPQWLVFETYDVCHSSSGPF